MVVLCYRRVNTKVKDFKTRKVVRTWRAKIEGGDYQTRGGNKARGGWIRMGNDHNNGGWVEG